MPTRRQSRVNDLLREELSDLLLREVKDPRLTAVTTITKVEVSPDLRSARVYVSTLGDEELKKQTMEGMEAAASFLRRGLKSRLALRYIPFLKFLRDNSMENSARLLALIQESSASSEENPAGEAE